MILTAACLLVPLAVATPPRLAPREEAPVHAVHRLEEGAAPPKIDGVLDEAIWAQVTPITDFRQVEPVQGAPASEATEIRILFDERAIFVSLVCRDSDPAGIRATQARRDANLDPDDRVELIFDTFHDRRNGFWFQIGPAGSRGDALIARNGGEFNKQWDTIWYGKARITADGWQAELEIPTSSINFDPAATSWGFNARRFIRRHNEEVQWASPDPSVHFMSAAIAGTLTDVPPLRQGIGLDIKPFAVGDFRHDESEEDDDFDLDAGLDLFYRITPDIKASVSFNTDFAETEVDARRVNLTRFPLFFPEKRDFFLEDSGNFLFGPGGRRGGGGGDAMPFFSRRLGIDPYGREIPLLAAMKLTGRTDSYSWGVMDVQTDDFEEFDAQNLAVARFSKNILEQSDVGVIATQGDPLGGDRNCTLGVDFNYRTNRFRGDRNLQFAGYALQSDTDGVSDNDGAYFAQGAYLNDEVQLTGDVTVVEENFDPALGFVPRRGIKKYRGSFAWRPRLHSAIRQLGFSATPYLITDRGNDLESAGLHLNPLSVEWESGDRVGLELALTRDVLDEDFWIRSDVLVPEATYDETRWGVDAHTSDKRELSGGAWFGGGDFWDGTREDWGTRLAWRPSAAATLHGTYERNDVDLDGGAFEVHIARLQADFQFGPNLAWMNFAQWDNQSDLIGLNSRLWWIPRPGTELFLVVNQGWEAHADHIVGEDRAVSVKVGTTFRL